jgi:hypothetical protein
MSATGKFISENIDMFPKVKTLINKASSISIIFENGREVLLPKEDENTIYQAVELQRMFIEQEKASRVKHSGWTPHWEPDDHYSY